LRARIEALSWVEELHRAYAEAASKALHRDVPALTSVTVRIPWVDPLAVFGQAKGARTFFERPSTGLSMVGIGSLWRMDCAGEGRFERASRAWKSLLARTIVSDRDAPPIPGPLGFAGFAFDTHAKPANHWLSFGQGRLVLSKILIVSKGSLSWLTLNLMAGKKSEGALKQRIDEAFCLLEESSKGFGALPEPQAGSLAGDSGENESAEDWKGAVFTAAQKIRQGTLQKVVLARQVCMRQEGRINPTLALNRMRQGFGECTLFAFLENEACFLGATPEPLVSLYDGSHVSISCLAGSAGRGLGCEEDLRLKERLLSDRKNRLEHALVVDAIKKALAPLCSEITLPPYPSLVCIRNIQHLHTLVLGILERKRANVLDLIGLLHPTPAVGGLPKEKALLLIRALEGFDRGWYSGPVGWVDGSGDGEMFVAIRSALLSGDEALLYAGCGIMADSDPEAEFEESRLKLEAMRWALNGKD